MNYKIDTKLPNLVFILIAISIAWAALNYFMGSTPDFQHFQHLSTSFISGVLWGVTYLFIRRTFNPDVGNMYDFSDDAIFGGVAAFASSLFKPSIMNLVNFSK